MEITAILPAKGVLALFPCSRLIFDKGADGWSL